MVRPQVVHAANRVDDGIEEAFTGAARFGDSSEREAQVASLGRLIDPKRDTPDAGQWLRTVGRFVVAGARELDLDRLEVALVE